MHVQNLEKQKQQRAERGGGGAVPSGRHGLRSLGGYKEMVEGAIDAES